jgi:hypothetical protein
VGSVTNPAQLPATLPFLLGWSGTFNELVYFTVLGAIYDLENPNPNIDSTVPTLQQVSAFIDFFPGNQQASFPGGFAVAISSMDHGDGTFGETLVPLAPITARLLNGQICTIAAGDPVGIQLLANTSILNLVNPLFYHVRFRNVTFGGGSVASLSNFAFVAPSSAQIIDITSPSLTRYEYGGP